MNGWFVCLFVCSISYSSGTAGRIATKLGGDLRGVPGSVEFASDLGHAPLGGRGGRKTAKIGCISLTKQNLGVQY